MLRSIHKLSESWFFKGILLITALSFMSFFGMGGLDEIQNRRDSVISVGDIQISGEELVRKFSKEVDKVRKSVGGNFTEQEAIQMGLLQKFISDEASMAAIRMVALDLGVVVTPEMLRRGVFSVPAFQDEEGEFSRQRFDYFLQESGFSEQAFLSNLSYSFLEDQILNPISGISFAPDIMVDFAYKSRFEKRDVDIITIDTSKMKIKSKPTQEELISYYESEKDKYMDPEYRGLSVILLSYEDIFNSIPVSEEEIRSRYEQNKSFYVKPERRDVDQIHFKTKEEATKALDEIKSGKEFRVVAEEKGGQSSEDTHLGWVEKDGVLSELADDLFSAKEGDIVGPIQSSMGWHILKVLAIEPQKETAFSKVKEIIAKELKKEKGGDQVYEQANRLDDFLASGKTLEEAAEEFNLKVINIPRVDVTGKDSSGKELPEIFSSPDFLEVAFSLNKGNESPVTESSDGFFVVRADEIIAPAAKPLSVVKKDVESLWFKDRQAENSKEIADKIFEAINAGKSFNSVAKAYGFNVEKISGLSRSGTSVLSSSSISKIFALPPYEVALISTPIGYSIVKVNRISFPAIENDSSVKEEIKGAVKDDISKAMLSDTLNDFSKMYKVNINYNQIKRLFSVSSETEE